MSDEAIKLQGRLGRSWGCPALRAGIAREVIDTVKGNGLVFAYYPDPQWLESSKYLGDCASAAAVALHVSAETRPSFTHLRQPCHKIGR